LAGENYMLAIDATGDSRPDERRHLEQRHKHCPHFCCVLCPATSVSFLGFTVVNQ